MSGTNPDAEAKLHLGYKMKYVPSMFFGNNLERGKASGTKFNL